MSIVRPLKGALVAGVLSLSIATTPAHAALVVNFFNGANLYATLTTSGATDFRLDFVGTNIASGAFINELFMDGPSGTFSDIGGASDGTVVTGTYKMNFYNGGGGQKIYDWLIQFPTANNPDRLTVGEHAIWQISPTNPDEFKLNKIHINAFDGVNSIKINGCIGADCEGGGGGDGDNDVPEPGVVALLGLGLAGIGLVRRRARVRG